MYLVGRHPIELNEYYLTLGGNIHYRKADSQQLFTSVHFEYNKKKKKIR